MLRFWKALNGLFGWLVIAVSVFILLIGVWQVYDNCYVLTHTIDDSVLRYKPDSTASSGGEETPFSDGMVGWISIEGTGIDYPVMQGKDNTEYLTKDPFGRYSATGSIFLDSRSSPDFSDSFSVIYGHHMDFGRMFGALDDFADETYLRQHTSGSLMTGRDAERTYPLEVFASMSVSATEKTVFDLAQDDIRQFIHDNAPVLTEEKDLPILALSTCADAGSAARTVVFCYILK